MMLRYLCQRLHPQFVLGIFLGLCVTFTLHSQKNIDLVYRMDPHASSRKEGWREGAYRQAQIEQQQHAMFRLEDLHTLPEYPSGGRGAPLSNQAFEDEHVHNDDDALAQSLYKQVRVLCWIMTSPSNLYKKAIHVKNTWARRCNVALFISSEVDNEFPTVALNVSEGRAHLTAKTMQAFSYIYDNHFQDAEWFLKADDDTYVIMENLRYMLSIEDPTKLIYFGHRFRLYTPQGYASGGAGYVLSKASLKRYSTDGRDKPLVCQPDKGAEDVIMGKCMSRLGVTLKSSVDALGRSRFHCFNPESLVNKRLPKWYYSYDLDKTFGGIPNMSDYTISFHYVTPERMHTLEFFTYHLQAYGIVHKPQNINVKTTLPPPRKNRKMERRILR